MTTVASPNEIEVTARAEERAMDLTHWSNNNETRHFRWTAEEILAHDDVVEERTDNLLLGWGVCKECVSKYKDDLVTLSLWLKRSWPHNLNVYCGILEGVRSQGLSHDMIVKAINRDMY